MRGALIFSAGLFVGYSIAIKNQEPNGEVKQATVELIRTTRAILVDAWLDQKIAGQKAVENAKEETPTTSEEN